MRWLPIVTMLCFAAGHVHAEGSGWVRIAQGEAVIIDGDVRAAAAQAERNALREALEFQIGVNIKSHTAVSVDPLNYAVR